MRWRALANRGLRKLGLELVPYSQLIDRLTEVCDGQDEFFFVQIGANDGVKFDELFRFVTSRPSRGLVVEPLTYYFNRLKQHYGPFPEIQPVNVALHAERRTAKIYYADPGRLEDLPEWAEGIGSLDPEHHKRSGLPSDSIVSQEVPCVCFMELLERYDVRNVDFLQLDVEGYDAEVLRMIDFARIKPRLIKYERVCLSRAEQRAAEQLLRHAGYRLVKEKTDNLAVLAAAA